MSSSSTPPRPAAEWTNKNSNLAERRRLAKSDQYEENWQQWGTYLSERQWGTVREDYSPTGEAWGYLPHDHARSRAYRWGEDGLLGWTDRQCRLCFAPALWNGNDPILKERLFGLTGPEGNHGEDVKELYYYLDSTPTASYAKGLYKYPHAAYPYQLLVEENARRGLQDPEFEILDSGVFNDSHYSDVFIEYAKEAPDDMLIRATICNRSAEAATLHFLPQLWFRNTWSWGCAHEGCTLPPRITRVSDHRWHLEHEALPDYYFESDPANSPAVPEHLFTENETNYERLFNTASPSPYTKDAFHRWLIDNETTAVSPAFRGTKAALHYQLELGPHQSRTLRFRLYCQPHKSYPGTSFSKRTDKVFKQRIAEADAFYADMIPAQHNREQANVMRQAWAGMIWSKQFYHYSVNDWLEGDAGQPTPDPVRKQGRNHNWRHLFNRDIISMPDKWEYPWYAAWDLAFHLIPFTRLDPAFAKKQILLLLREWYMHPNGQIPAYEWAFDDVNPPVHAWAAWRIYKMTAPEGERDKAFLREVFHKLLLNFTWWVNRKDPDGRNLFSGGFLGLDNIGPFDRSHPLPDGYRLEQADGTAWMAFYCGTMLAIALELATDDSAYDGIASKFFEHFMTIAEAINTSGADGLWDDADGFYYDQVHHQQSVMPLKIRSLVGLLPLCAVEIIDHDLIQRLPRFRKRMEWFLSYRRDIIRHISCLEGLTDHSDRLLLALPTRDKLERILGYLFNENEFLSPFGIRSLSRYHKDHPYVLAYNGTEERVTYLPGESDSWLFGGNSNWRGPVWFPVNFLILEALQKYHHFYQQDVTVTLPGHDQPVTLDVAAQLIVTRLSALFLPSAEGFRPAHGPESVYGTDPHFKDLVLFYEYFHGDTGRGLGASHQTGWTGLIAKLLFDAE